MKHPEVKLTLINDGWVEPIIEPEAYIFGSSPIPDEILRPDGQWDDFLPVDEVQVKGFDTFGCTIFGTTNQIEVYERAKFGGNPNYSDRAGYIMADIKPPGQDPQVVYETIRKQGLLNEEDLPWGDHITSLEKYAYPKPLWQNLIEKALAWLSKYVLKHEWLRTDGQTIDNEIIREALKRSPVAAAVNAWSQKGDKYIRMGDDTHWTLLTGTYPDGDWKCLDTYPPFRKRLDKNFKFRWGKRIWIGKKEEEDVKQISLLRRLAEALATLLGLLKSNPVPKPEEKPITMPDEVVPAPVPVTPKESLQDMARRVCKEEGIQPSVTRTILATIHGESGWNPKAKNHNYKLVPDPKDPAKKIKVLSSTDWGLCQLNDKWYVGPTREVKTPEEALSNPEKCVRVMVKAWKKGRSIDWVAYKTGAFKKYLSFYA